jgi:hypothetical protein
MSRKLYNHLNRNQLIQRFDELGEFMNLSHHGKKTFLQELYREERMKEFYYFSNYWKQQKLKAAA